MTLLTITITIIIILREVENMAQSDVKAAVMKSIEAIQANPMLSTVLYKASTQWEEDVRCSATVRDFAPMIIDEPPELAGKNAGPSPVELILVALGTCQEIVYSAYASVMGIELTSVKVDVKGKLDLKGLFGLDKSVPAGFKSISFTTSIESPADEESIRALIETVESCCPVMDILNRPMSVSGVAKLNGKEVLSTP
jgi:putative redox protein